MTKPKKPEEKKKAGRPSKYGKIDIRQVETVAGYGFIETEIAAILNIAPSTLSLYKKRPAFSEALKKGKAKADFLVVESLHKRACGTGDNPGDVTAQIFWLKNRRRDLFGERQGIDLSGSIRTERGKLIVEVVEVKSEIPTAAADPTKTETLKTGIVDGPETLTPGRPTPAGGPGKDPGPGAQPPAPAAKEKPKGGLYARAAAKKKAPAAPAAPPRPQGKAKTAGPRPRSLSTGTTRPGPSPGRPTVLKTGGPAAAKAGKP